MLWCVCVYICYTLCYTHASRLPYETAVSTCLQLQFFFLRDRPSARVFNYEFLWEELEEKTSSLTRVVRCTFFPQFVSKKITLCRDLNNKYTWEADFLYNKYTWEADF